LTKSDFTQGILLRQHGDLSFKEIAALLGEPLNTVLSHMHYAVTKLRQQLRCVDAK
jgi:DNA-directed RNA polymerase specialized sigma24 family protein